MLRQQVAQIKEKKLVEEKAAKRLAEKESLVRTIEEATYKAVQQPTEFDSAMSLPDTERVLKTPRKTKLWLERSLQRFMAMAALRPISGTLLPWC